MEFAGKLTQPTSRTTEVRSGAWAVVSLGELCNVDDLQLLGTLGTRFGEAGFRALESDQILAWRTQLSILREVVSRVLLVHPIAASWVVALEYEIPRREKRIDAVLILPFGVIVLEFKVGSRTYARSDLWQAQDYRLELADFHEASRGIAIEAILVATAAEPVDVSVALDEATGVWRANADSLQSVLLAASSRLRQLNDVLIEPEAWVRSGYRPTPTIVEAARRVFDGHGVRELSHAYADNLSATTGVIQQVIMAARKERRRVICFVTGVPGAGKTLAGLTAMQDVRTGREGTEVAAFMSGNGPLVKVVREALIRDRVAKGSTRTSSARQVELLVQNVHRFIENYGVKQPHATPPEHVIAFDEAQRGWHAEKLAKRHKHIAKSESALVLDIMARPLDWAVVVALVGGGQEIHDGEAGLEQWGRAIQASTVDWDVVVSPDALRGAASVAGHRLFEEEPPTRVIIRREPSMHLSVSVRSPKAQRLAEWVNCVIALDAAGARAIVNSTNGFRLLLTRDLCTARIWLRKMATGSLRGGLLASSGAIRLRAHGLEVDPNFRKGFSFERWFLDDRKDHRSSHFLEVPATDFECQGLELDYSGVCWGDDLTVSQCGREWICRTLRGAEWKSMASSQKRRYLVNKYRVLLTRSREGMVIWVPHGDPNDPTRRCEPLDATAEFLEQAGAVMLPA